MPRSDRFDAALKSLGERFSQGGFICPGDIQVVASRHSDTPEEREALVAWLTLRMPED
jgi:hypothetical protein